jgi:hypothetical protein
MSIIQYGVVGQGGRWSIIGDGLKYGSYPTSAKAERAATRLALNSGGLPVLLHVQDETGELKQPTQVN